MIETLLKCFILVNELKELKHFTSRPDLFGDLFSEDYTSMCCEVLVILNDKSAKVAVEEVALAMRVHRPIVCKALIVLGSDAEVHFRETPLFFDQFLKVAVSKDAVKRQRLVR